MILHKPETIRGYTEAGLWDTRTLIDVLHKQVAVHPQRLAICDPADRKALVGIRPRQLNWDAMLARPRKPLPRLIERELKKDEVVILHLLACLRRWRCSGASTSWPTWPS